MRELENKTIEEKAKVYDKIINKLKGFLMQGVDSLIITRADVQDFFPELKESEDEDERIRKALIEGLMAMKNNFHTISSIKIDDAIAWLERQDGQKSVPDWMPKFLDELRAKKNYFDWDEHKDIEGYILAIINWMKPNYFNRKNDKHKPAKNIIETWKDMRLEVYQQVSGNRHEPNYSDDTTKMFSLIDIDEIIEKMSEQKLQGKSALVAINEEKVVNADKVEPKFHEGEWVVCEFTGLAYQIKNSVENLSNHKYGYDLINGGYISSDEVNYYHLWTIQDAKDGDVLQLGLVTAIFQEYIGNGNCKCYCSICGEFEIPSQEGADNSYGCSDAAPATKEQRDVLMEAMADEGYIFDFEKKELKRIEQKSCSHCF